MTPDDRPSVIRRKSDGFFTWEPCFFSPNVGRGLSDTLRTTEVQTSAGIVRLSLSKTYCESEVINSYEWESRLLDGSDGVKAVAVGSLFLRKPKQDFHPSEFDLASAADQASEKDLILIDAYLELLQSGREFSGFEQLCTVLTWERNLGAARGTGLICLETGIRVLKKKYKAINTLVINAWPQQFRFGTVTDASDTAARRVLSYLESKSPGSWVGTRAFTAIHPLYDEKLDPHDMIYGKWVVRETANGNFKPIGG